MVSTRQHVVNNRAREVALLIADIYEAAGAFRRSGETIAGAEGQTQARWQLMSVVSGGPMTVPQVARRLGITRQGVQRVANDLVDEGLVRLTPNPDHRSSSLLELTSQGQAVLGRINNRAHRLNSILASTLDAPKLSQTRAVLRTLIDANSTG
ncbi:MarR family winged helix-turn-helix transcriptional regulator [Mycobacterium neumannii]|uniref:MarR family winged helix-turn-helix transcriptional regulator n=1 Tax=Mycobacterium neumannii TaxID=2048551 RepID=UPI000B93AE10|nr:MarR family transcriptional regulator [Mycobacterium neumannii]